MEGRFPNWHLFANTNIMTACARPCDSIEAGKILPPAELARLGLTPRRLLRMVLETLEADDSEIGITAMNARGGAFDHLTDEPDLYSDSDLIERNETFSR